MDQFNQQRKSEPIQDPTSHRRASKTPEKRSIEIAKPKFGQF